MPEPGGEGVCIRQTLQGHGGDGSGLKDQSRQRGRGESPSIVGATGTSLSPIP